MSEHEAHALRHVALLGVRLLRVIAEISAVKHPANDLAQDEDADNGPVEDPADEEALDVRLAAAAHPPGEGVRVGGWQHPALMERATQPVRGNNLRAVALRRLAEVDAFAHLERIFGIRFRHAVPTIAEPR
jgi:hypothetical protein